MKIWIDSTKKPTCLAEYGMRCKNIDEAKDFVSKWEKHKKIWEIGKDDLTKKCYEEKTSLLIDIGFLDHYVEFLAWLAETNRNYPIHIHATNPLEIEKIREAVVKNGLQEKDPCKSVCIWIDHEQNEPNGFYRLDTVNKVKNCILWCEENGWSIGCVDSCVTIEKSREVDGGSILMLLSWLKDTGRYYLFRYH